MDTDSKKITFGIRLKLFILVFVSLSLLIAVTVWRVGIGANEAALETIDRSLEQSSVVLKTKMDSRYASIAETVVSLARDGRVLPLVFDAEAATLQDLSIEFQAALEFDSMFVTDSRGTILARSDRPEAIGRSVAGRSALFDAALNGEVVQGIIASKGKLLQIVAAPVFDNVAKDLVRGSIALAYELSPEIALEINKLTASDISFFIFTRDDERNIAGAKSTYSTDLRMNSVLDGYFEQHAEAWRNTYDGDGQDSNLEFDIEGNQYHAVLLPLAKYGGGNLGFVMAVRSENELLKPFLDIQRQVIIVGAVCLLIATLIAGLISHNISRPIISLVSVTREIEKGNLPDDSSVHRSKDEVGLLADALFRMGKSIKEKSDLEQYLAQLAEDLDESDTLDIAASADVVELTDHDQVAPTPSAPREETRYNDTGRPLKVSASKAAPVSADSGDDMDRTVITDPAVLPEEKTDALASLSIGQRVDGRYELIRMLGVGAMGRVFLAKDHDLDENIAIKILQQDKFTERTVGYFKEEIRLARRITHRNILRTFDFGVWKDCYYITMEYVFGHELAEVISRKGPLDFSIGIMMARQICSAMSAAHEQGIIHRDLKPSNMMINKQGILKIMDFGLAMQIEKRRHDSELPESGEAASNVSTIAGTPQYMAPEQFQGGELDERSDIYAIGAILYTIFTGGPPFVGRTMQELEEHHLQSPPPLLRDTLGSAPEKLEHIIVKAMSKNKSERYDSINAILNELQTV